MAIPALNTSIDLNTELPPGSETFAIVHLAPDGSRKISRYYSRDR